MFSVSVVVHLNSLKNISFLFLFSHDFLQHFNNAINILLILINDLFRCFAFLEICSFSFECLIFVSVSRMGAFSFWKYTVSQAYLTFIAIFCVIKTFSRLKWKILFLSPRIDPKSKQIVVHRYLSSMVSHISIFFNILFVFADSYCFACIQLDIIKINTFPANISARESKRMFSVSTQILAIHHNHNTA